jgi:hypothetical protein
MVGTANEREQELEEAVVKLLPLLTLPYAKPGEAYEGFLKYYEYLNTSHQRGGAIMRAEQLTGPVAYH